MRDIFLPLRMGLYPGVLLAAGVFIVGSLDFSMDQTIRHVAELRTAAKSASLRPSSVAPAPILTAKDFDAAQAVPVTVTGEAASKQMGLAEIDPVTTDSVAGGQPKVFRVGNSGLNMRSGPGKDSAKTSVLGPGEEVEVGEADRNWVRVIRRSGESGWVFSKYLVPVEP
jgi:uncharacterized protein YgiM (DUF1202 family)